MAKKIFGNVEGKLYLCAAKQYKTILQTNFKWQQKLDYNVMVARTMRSILLSSPIAGHTNPATITLNFERALYWVTVGAEPTDTVRAILSNEGVLLMKHLMGGVAKGAFDQAEAERRFAAWKASKDAKVASQKSSMASKAQEAAKERLEAETAKNKAKAEAVAKKKAEAAAAAAAAEAPAEGEGEAEAPAAE